MNKEAGSVRPTSSAVRLTPGGLWVIALGIGLGVVLASTKAGLTQLVVAIAVALLVLAPFVAWLHARRLELSAPDSCTVFAGRAFELVLVVWNRQRLFTARDLFAAYEEPGRIEPVPAAFVPACPPRRKVSVHTQHGRLERGRHAQVDVVLTSTYPFGLALVRKRYVLPVAVLVLPRLGSLVRIERLVAPTMHLAPRGPSGPWGEDEFRGLREWRDGESLRRVHWKLSARRGKRVVREFEGSGRSRVHVVLSALLPSERTKGRRSGAFERAVSFAATLVEHYLRRRHPVRLTILGQTARTISTRQGRAGLFPLLAALADAEPTSPSDDAAPLRPSHDELTVVVALHGPEPGRTGTFSARDVSRRWLDLRDPRARRMFRSARSAGAVNPLAWSS